jgi:hypothetical protein
MPAQLEAMMLRVVLVAQLMQSHRPQLSLLQRTLLLLLMMMMAMVLLPGTVCPQACWLQRLWLPSTCHCFQQSPD